MREITVFIIYYNTSLNIIFLKPGQIVQWKQCYVRQGKFQMGHQAKFLFERNQDIKSLCGCKNNLELLYFDKYQTWVSKYPSASNRTSVVSKEHLVVFSLTFFEYALKPTAQCKLSKLINRMSVLALLV